MSDNAIRGLDPFEFAPAGGCVEGVGEVGCAEGCQRVEGWEVGVGVDGVRERGGMEY